MELSLKALYLGYSNDSSKHKISIIKDAGHNLMKMWNYLEPILIEASGSTADKNMVSVVKSYVEQFHQMDKTSFSFRYPITKEMVPVFQDEQRIDLINLKNCVQELSNFFDGMDGLLDDQKRSKEEAEAIIREINAEIEAEFRAEMMKEMRSNYDWDY